MHDNFTHVKCITVSAAFMFICSAGPKGGGGLGGTCPPEEAVSALKKIMHKYDIATMVMHNWERLLI